MACADPPAPAEARPAPPRIPAPATTGAFLAEDDPLARPVAAVGASPEALVPQLRPGDAIDLAFVGRGHLAVLDASGDIALLDTEGGAVRAIFGGAGRAPLTAAGPLLLANSMAVDLRSGVAWLPLVEGLAPRTGFSAVSPRGDRFVALDLGATRDGALLATLPSGALTARLVHGAGAGVELGWTPSGERFVLCGSEAVELRDGDDGALAGRFAPAEGAIVEHCAIRPAGGAIAALGSDHAVTLLDPRTLAVRATVRPVGEAQPDRLAWSSDGNHLVAWRRGSTHLTVWDAVSGALRRSAVAAVAARSVAVTAGGRWVVVGGEDGSVHAIALDDGSARELAAAADQPAAVAVDETGAVAAFATGPRIELVDLASGERTELSSLSRPAAATVVPASGVRSPDVLFRVTGWSSSSLWRWRPTEGLRRLIPEVSVALEAEIGDARYIDEHAAFDAETGAAIFDVEDRTLLHVSDDGSTFVARLGDGRMVVLDAEGRERAAIAFDRGEEPPCRDRPRCGLPTALSRDGRSLVMLRNSLLRVFDTATGRVVARRDVGGRASERLELSRDGSVLSVLVEDERLELLDARTLRPRGVVSLGSGDAVPVVDFSPEGTLHVHSASGILGALRLSGPARPVEVPVAGETLRIEAISEALVIRETELAVELYDAERLDLLLRMDASPERLVLRASQGPDGATLELIECAGGRLLRRSASGARAELGRCAGALTMQLAGERVVIGDDAGVRVVHPDDGSAFEVLAIPSSGMASPGLGLLAADGLIDGPESLATLYLVRGAGPVLEAPLGPATARLRR